MDAPNGGGEEQVGKGRGKGGLRAGKNRKIFT